MKKILKFIGILAVFSCITGWVFYADHFAIDKTNRYRPLANGWVSYHAAMYLREGGSFVDKVKTAISDELGIQQKYLAPYVGRRRGEPLCSALSGRHGGLPLQYRD